MNIFITGAASGIGRAVCERFAGEGHTVYALDIKELSPREGVVGFTADITSQAELCSVSEYFSEHGITLDVILNVAGIHEMASLVEDDPEVMDRLIDINLVGAMRVVRAMHKHLAPRGRIVVVTSEVASLAPMPFNGLYNVSKTALDCYAQALRQELGLIGQQVVTIRPGAVETPLADGSVRATAALAERTVLYRGQASRFSRIASRFMGTPIKAEKLADLIYRASTCRRPRAVYSKHRNAGLVLLSLLPLRLQCLVIRLLLGKG